MLRSNRIAYIGALCCLPLILAASHADAAPTEEKDDLVVPQKQLVPEQISADVRTIGGFPQPQLVATHEIAIGYNPTQGLVRETYQLRHRIQDSKGGLGMKTASEAVTRPDEPVHGRYRHTASDDPYVDAHD